MKKTILVVLMAVMISTPCFSQEVGTDGIFSIEGTEWHALPIGMMVVSVFPIPRFFQIDEFSIGFDGGRVYPPIEGLIIGSSYQDMMLAGIFRFNAKERYPITHQEITGFGILQPIGIGVIFQHYSALHQPSGMTMMILIKADDD